MNWRLRKKMSPAAEAYAEATPKRYNRKLPVEERLFLVLDAETTGFDLSKDRILSLATVPVQGREISIGQVRSWIVYQPASGVTEAVQVHGILPVDTRAGQSELRVMEELLPLLHGAIVVGHHINFDAALLDQALKRHFGLGLINPLLDTAILAQVTVDAFARSGYANQRPPTLDEICSHLEIETVERHTAAGDAFTTAELFLLLCARFRQRLKRPLLIGDLPIERR